MKDKNFIIGAIGGIIGVVGIIVGIVGIKSAEDIATRSGSFDKGNLVAKISNVNVNTNSTPINLVFGVDFKRVKKGLVIGDIPITIANTGNKSIKDVTVTYIYPEIFKRDVFENLKCVPEGSYDAKEIDRHFSKMGNQHYSSYRLPRLEPGTAIVVRDPVVLPETRFAELVSLPDWGELSVVLEYGMEFDIFITAEDIIPLKQAVTYRVINAQSKTDFINKFKNKMVNIEAKELRDNATFLQYLGHIMFRRKEMETVLIYPEILEHKIAEGKIFSAFSNEKDLTTASYDLISYNLLLH